MVCKDDDVIIYIAPMKALIEEKKREWSKETHPFSKRRMAVVTGDYAKTNSSQAELDEATLILMTPESFLSRIRRHSSAKSKFLSRVKRLVVDEIHMVGEAGRGGNLEVAIIEFSYLFPVVPILALSATLKNYADIVAWIEETNGKTTHCIYSEYRPYPVEDHFVTYTPGYSYQTELQRLLLTIQIIQENPDKTFLVGVFKKSFGQRIYNELRKLNISVEFHYADLAPATKERIEGMQKDGLLRVLIATKTVFAGVNLVADGVIVTDVFAGGEEVDANELQQVRGRTGRFRPGHAFFFVPAGKTKDYHIKRIQEGAPVVSTLIDWSTVSTHLLGAIYIGRIKQPIDFLLWYMTTLAYKQTMALGMAHIKELLNKTLKDMQLSGMTRYDEKVLTLSQKGKICAQLLLDPYWMYDLTKNLRKYLELANPTDADLACAFGACKPFFASYNTDQESGIVPLAIKGKAIKQFWKSSSVYYFRLTKQEVPGMFKTINWKIWQDLSRCKEGILRIGSESEQWDKLETVEKAFIRIARGVSWNEADLILHQFNKRERTALNRAGIFSIEDAKRDNVATAQILSESRMKELGILVA